MSEETLPLPRGAQAREIGDAIVRLTRDAMGRGPVRARVIIDGDAIVVLMHETLTRGEQTLVEHGRTDEVLALRRAFQEVMREQYTAVVERITGRTVHTFMSANHTDPDHAAEIFLLEDAAG